MVWFTCVSKEPTPFQLHTSPISRIRSDPTPQLPSPSQNPPPEPSSFPTFGTVLPQTWHSLARLASAVSSVGHWALHRQLNYIPAIFCGHRVVLEAKFPAEAFRSWIATFSRQCEDHIPCVCSLWLEVSWYINPYKICSMPFEHFLQLNEYYLAYTHITPTSAFYHL